MKAFAGTMLLAQADANPAVRTLHGMWEGFLARLPLLGIGVIVIIATWAAAAILSRLAGKLLDRPKLRDSLQVLLRRLLIILVWIIGLLVTAMVIFPGLTPTKALAGLGIASVAIGFAFKDIFENFFAGILILWRFPIEKGDFIRIQEIEGKVDEINIRNTQLRKTTGELVVLPNSTIFSNPLEVQTNRPVRRTTFIAGVSYDTDIDRAREVIRSAVTKCSSVSLDQPPEIFAQELGSSSVNFEVTWWTKPTPLDIRNSTDEVISAVKRALDEAGMEIPFPYRTLTFKEPLAIQREQT